MNITISKEYFLELLKCKKLALQQQFYLIKNYKNRQSTKADIGLEIRKITEEIEILEKELKIK